MKAKELLEGIQRRTKQVLPRVVKYKNIFFATELGWVKQQVLYSMEERISENQYMVGDAKRPVWDSLAGKNLQPNDISDKDMEAFVLEWAFSYEQEGNAVWRVQNEALEGLGEKLLKI